MGGLESWELEDEGSAAMGDEEGGMGEREGPTGDREGPAGDKEVPIGDRAGPTGDKELGTGDGNGLLRAGEDAGSSIKLLDQSHSSPSPVATPPLIPLLPVVLKKEERGSGEQERVGEVSSPAVELKRDIVASGGCLL